MKKNILGGIVVLAIAAVAAWNVSMNSQKNVGLSDVMLANVEALADGESGGLPCTQGCRSIGWGFSQILKCDCDYTGWFSSCDSWGCI
jgi:hypothetical protein